MSQSFCHGINGPPPRERLAQSGQVGHRARFHYSTCLHKLPSPAFDLFLHDPKLLIVELVELWFGLVT